MMNRFIVFLFIFYILFSQYIAAEKVVISRVGFQPAGSEEIDIYRAGGDDVGFGLKSSETVGRNIQKAVVVPDDHIVKTVKVYVIANSSKRIDITLACLDVKNNVLHYIANKTISALGTGIQEIALDMLETNHVTNPNKYEYMFHLDFKDGGDDGNLMFYGAKIKLKEKG